MGDANIALLRISLLLFLSPCFLFENAISKQHHS
jgi:hypothetical protein